MKKNKMFFGFFLILIFSVFIFTGCMGMEKAAVADGKEFVITGTVEAEEIDIRSKIPGRIKALHIEEGDEVEKGALLVEIDPKDLEVKKLQAQAAVKASEAQLNKAINGARRQDINAAKTLLEKAEAKVQLIQTKHERYLPLYEAGAMPKDKLDDLETELNVAKLDAQAAKEQYELALEGARHEDIEAAQAQYELYQAQLQEVLINLEETEITAPMGGSITMLISKEGELVGSSMPILTITDYHNSWVEVNIDEIDIGRVKIGQMAQIKSKAYPGEIFQGKVISINKNPDFAIKKSTNELNDQDVITYAVKIKLEITEKQLYPGMLVEVLLSGNEG